MSKNEHIYAVARIRAKEIHLLDSVTMEQLISTKSLEAMNKILFDKGWGDGSENKVDIFSIEREKTWSFIEEIIQDMTEFDTLRVEKDFHNIKAAIKAEYANKMDDNSIYQKYGSVSVADIKEAIRTKKFSILPEKMQNPAEKAYEYMFKTGDGQICDVILDRACLEVMLELSKESENALLIEYAQMKTAIANIKVAIRGAKTGKEKKFFERAMVDCNDLNIDLLSRAAIQGVESIYSYLETTRFKEAVEAIKTDFSVFETWCDNQIITSIKKEKYTSTTISPIIAYILARENEIKMVRILTVAKRNNLMPEEVKKRMRDMYV